MLKGLGRHTLRGGSFEIRPNLRGGGSSSRQVATSISRSPPATAEVANIPQNTVMNSFAKPTQMPLNVGLVSDGTQAQIVMAREMFDNDSIAGAVAETLGNIPFGRFSLSGLPDAEHQEPYLRSLDHMRVQTLMPLLATTFLVDGAFLGSGLFDSQSKSWSAMILQDVLHANVMPVPYFGATPIIDVQLTPEMVRSVNSMDPRMARYRRFLTDDIKQGIQRLQPENTFYIPRRTMAHHSQGQSLFRRIMILYALEKALARGTIEMAYRRQKPLLHIQCGDENWDASIEEMQDIARLFMNADLDPLGATVVTRPGVSPQEISGMNDMFKWTDIIDQLTSAKLKGLGMPDGLLGGDVALDSVSATLTVFINQMRQFRDYITRAFMYEKMFPYLAVTNGHRRDIIAPHEERGAASDSYRQWLSDTHQSNYHAVASDLDVDMSQYIMPTVSWHNSMRPEGDRDYLGLLTELGQAGIPVPIRMLAAAGGMDMNDILNGRRDDIEQRGKTAEYQADINALTQATQGDGQDDQGGGDQDAAYAAAIAHERGIMDRMGSPVRPKGLVNREWSDRDLPRTNINGTSYVTTARERKRMIEEENKRLIAPAMARVARRENHYNRHDHRVAYGPQSKITPV